MNKNEMLDAIQAKVDELYESIEVIKNNPKLSENTYKTQRYQRTHEARNLLIMAQLIKDGKLSDEAMGWFVSATTLTSVRKAKNTIVFKDGDDLLTIMNEHPNVNYKKLKDMIAEQGFMLDGHIVRK